MNSNSLSLLNLFASLMGPDVSSQLSAIESSISGILLVISLTVGVLQCFFGYKLMKFWIALAGLVVGGVLGAIVGGALSRDVGSAVIVGILGAILVAFLAVKIYYIGLFVFGSGSSFFIALLLTDKNVTLSIVFALVIGFLTAFMAKRVVIVVSAISGGVAIGSALGSQADQASRIPLMLLLSILFSVLGLLYQFKSNGGVTTQIKPKSNTTYPEETTDPTNTTAENTDGFIPTSIFSDKQPQPFSTKEEKPRYKIISTETLQDKKIDLNAPVEVISYEILNNEQSKAFINIGFLNLNLGTVSAMKLVFIGHNSFDELVKIDGNDSFTSVLQDLNVKPGTYFENDAPIYLPNEDIRKLDIIVNQVLFADGQIINNQNPQIVQPTLREIVSQNEINLAHTILPEAQYYAKEEETYWLCACGRPNPKDQITCSFCGSEKEIILLNLKEEFLIGQVKIQEEERIAKAKVREEEELKIRQIRREEYLVKQEKYSKIVKKIARVSVPVCVVVMVVMVSLLVMKVIIPTVTYNKAINLMNSGNNAAAITAFQKIRDYKDSETQIRKIVNRNSSIISYDHGVFTALKTDGTVLTTGDNYNEVNVSGWKDITAVSSGDNYIVGLKSNGTVVVSEKSLGGHVSSWGNMIAISTGGYDTVGLRDDGTVAYAAYAGVNTSITQSLSTWKDIVAIYASNNFILGLKKDGTVVAAGEGYDPDVTKLKNIVKLSINAQQIVGLRDDGTVIAFGTQLTGFGKDDKSSVWKDIIDISVGSSQGVGITYGLRSDGTIVCTEGFYIPKWNNITAISCDNADHNIVGLKTDGTVITDPSNPDFKVISGWSNIGRIKQ